MVPNTVSSTRGRPTEAAMDAPAVAVGHGTHAPYCSKYLAGGYMDRMVAMVREAQRWLAKQDGERDSGSDSDRSKDGAAKLARRARHSVASCESSKSDPVQRFYPTQTP